MLRVGMPLWTLCVRFCDAERHGLHSHAERGNDQYNREGAREGPHHLERNRIPSSSPRRVSGYIWSSIRSRTILVDAV
ncbi:hypothetical protein CCU68_32945 [Pseudomonas gingeri NCPPB 3146 = LMG 5327]|uniref:Secreted protein n=1 Tax=Pseudomonas gingeri NCPPB 3146 = LMG 5327 TaxID=707248 RepID=A0ABX4XUC0_9PSED|nr:hypothetical protein CCU68_32945 [Pseudomonas gingeri NCPPB 3146 = LMG 5327]